MTYSFPDFVVVVCADNSCYKDVAGILNKQSAVALNILTYEEWMTDGHILPYNLLLIRADCSWLYAKDNKSKGHIRKEIESALDRQYL